MRMQKAMRPAISYAEENGFQVSQTRGGHVRFSREGFKSVFTSSTTSDRRAALNAISLLRRSLNGQL